MRGRGDVRIRLWVAGKWMRVLKRTERAQAGSRVRFDALAGREGKSGVGHAQDLGGDTVWDAWASDPSEETFDLSMEMVLCAAAC